MQFLTIATAFLLAGNAVCGLGFGRVKSGVVIDGVNVGGLPYREAEMRLHENLLSTLSPLVVHAPKGDLILDLPVTDNAKELVRSAKKDEALSLSFSRLWTDMEGDLKALCARNSFAAADAKVDFSERGFSYTPERNGAACNFSKLVRDALFSLSERAPEIYLETYSYSPKTTEEILKRRTQKLASFSTAFDETNEPRAHNIALAAKKISGSVIGPKQEFSFNGTVGERTEENGFRVANVIYEGKFVPGVGGGVCQVSSTLFGAALRAGLSIEESHAHSLSVGYVPPSLDAMVSSSSDLRFVNPYDFPVYLLGGTKGGSVGFSIYGLPDGKIYKTESITLSHIRPPAPEIIEGERGIIKDGKEGIKSESYLLVYDRCGRLLSRTRIRKDCYAAVRGKVGALPISTEEKEEEGIREGNP